MTKKYIKALTFLGLIAILVLQSLWLINTYKLIEHRIAQTSDYLFPKAIVDEAIERLDRLTDEQGTETTLHPKADMDFNRNIDDQQVLRFLSQFLNHYADSIFQSSISLPLLDSLYTKALAGEGFQAELVCQMVDSLGNVLQQEENKTLISSFRTIKTSAVFLDKERTQAVQAVIFNPYWIAFRQMGVLLVATAILILFVAACIIYQVKIIIKQNKIARLRQDFTYAMIHDMKTPISTISMAGHTLESGILDNKPMLKKQYFSILNEESEHLLNLSEKILTIAKLEQSRLKLIKSPVDLLKLFEELTNKYKVKAEKKVDFQITCPITYSLIADEEYLKEAISNLIDNSLKYSDDKVQIRLSADSQGDFIRIKVWDNGWGIPLKQQKHIFEKFQRGGLEYQKEKKVSGFGLGLNYVYKVITAMGGTVDVNSVEGEYCEFVLSLPIQTEKI